MLMDRFIQSDWPLGIQKFAHQPPVGLSGILCVLRDCAATA